jgi:ATP-dependent DNA ligase
VADYSPARLQLVDRLPTGFGWIYEPKFDGYRGLLSRSKSGRPALLSRNGKDLGRYFPELLSLAEHLAPGTVIDGEIVCPVDSGVSFTSLQRRLMMSTAERINAVGVEPVALIAFDLLHDHASDVRPAPLSRRRLKLGVVVEATASPLLQLISHVDSPQAAAAWLDDHLEMAGIEGVVAKRDEAYPAAAVRRWQKVRRLLTMDVVVQGFVGERGARRLVVGLDQGSGVGILGTTYPISEVDERVLEPLVPHATASDRPIWAPFDSHRDHEWFVLASPLHAEIAYSHLDGGVLRHTARFLRWRFVAPPDRQAGSDI